MNNFLAQVVSPTLIFHLSLAYTPTELDYNPKISFLQLQAIYYHTPNFIFCFGEKKFEPKQFSRPNKKQTDIEKLMVWKIKKKDTEKQQ